VRGDTGVADRISLVTHLIPEAKARLDLLSKFRQGGEIAPSRCQTIQHGHALFFLSVISAPKSSE
jgi:hypothetical protein